MAKVVLIASVIAALLGAASGWRITSWVLNSRHEAEVQRMRGEASAALQAATERAMIAERQNADMANNLEVQNAKNRKRLDAVLADNRRLARELGGLRDPYATASGCAMPTSAEPTGSAAYGTATGRLSDEASHFLLEFARDADQAAEYAATCYQWIDGLAKQ